MPWLHVPFTLPRLTSCLAKQAEGDESWKLGLPASLPQLTVSCG